MMHHVLDGLFGIGMRWRRGSGRRRRGR
jgi:hypothetical protein